VSLNLLTIWPANVRTGPATANNYLSNGQNNYNSYNGVMKIDHRFSASPTFANLSRKIEVEVAGTPI
jgi:hypothetical protein